MYICCALVGAINDSVSQNAQYNSENYIYIYIYIYTAALGSSRYQGLLVNL
jgi:hypothetical protein